MPARADRQARSQNAVTDVADSLVARVEREDLGRTSHERRRALSRSGS